MLNPQTEIKFSDYNSLYDILNPTVNGFRDFSLSFLIDYKQASSPARTTRSTARVCTRVRCLAVQLITREAVALSVPVS